VRLASFLAAAGIGAAAMYLLDPDRGRRRRAMLRDRVTSAVNTVEEAAGVTWRDSRNRLQGVAARLRSDPDEADQSVLIERVRSQLGRVASHPKAIHVLADDGSITLQGAILEHEREAVVSAARETAGVDEVVDRLHGFESAGDIPSLQGGRDRQRLAEWRQSNWSPAMRFASGVGSVSLIGLGLSRRGPIRLAALAAGSALLLRSARNEPLHAHVPGTQ
jgi:hypothetical protein